MYSVNNLQNQLNFVCSGCGEKDAIAWQWAHTAMILVECLECNHSGQISVGAQGES